MTALVILAFICYLMLLVSICKSAGRVMPKPNRP